MKYRENAMAKRNRTSDEKGRFRDLRDALHMELREHRSSFIVYFTLRGSTEVLLSYILRCVRW